MALAIEVSKVSVHEVMAKLFSVTLNLRCLDGAEEVLNKNFSEHHRLGMSIPYTFGKFQMKMQEAIDIYKGEQVIYTSAALDNAVVALQNGLEG
jgi:hypothetical protein